MLREGKKLPPGVQKKIPEAVEKLAEDRDVVAVYAFGSLAEGNLKPLSDLDFGILLSDALDRKTRFKKSITLIGILNETFETDEVDLVILNDDPLRFSYQVLKTGKLLYCRDQSRLAEFTERTVKRYLDFKPARDQFDQAFLDGIGYHG